MKLLSICRVLVFFACLAPFAWALYGAVAGTLGPDPGETLMHITGEWALRLLLLTLLITPLRKWTGQSWWQRYRRMLGLYAFFYAVVHLTTFAHFYLGWSGGALLEELAERPYITAGGLGLLLMLPLAMTSTRAMQRRLGRHWVRLHRLIYAVAVVACVHLVWQIRSDAGGALVYSALVAALLAWRLPFWRRRIDAPVGRAQPLGGGRFSP